ncbi:steroid receptor RNA activator 1-like isoform X2 [Centruroides sculpturatus]|uniref:steroid receptor RNA activator 1-like isoform X2 n=1 Tax=Centruroides sculpturatus TaxID=218467 RepID=UPI000C6D0E6F|nr:steroid receptor RNA activator 1-like isoform X2 [Centruroides sculpturatus]
MNPSDNNNQYWNDPPQFAYSGQTMSSSMPKRLLNKYAPYPEMTGKSNDTPPPIKLLGTLLPVSVNTPDSNPSEASPQQNVVVLPPTADNSVPPPQPLSTDGFSNLINSTTQQTTDHEEDEMKSDDDMNTLVLNTFEKLLEICSEHMQEKKVNEVKRRLNILSECWKDEKLSNTIKQKLYKLVTAILKKKYDVADSIHLSLMMDHFSEVGTWMVGVKHLLHEAKERNIFITDGAQDDDKL